MNNIINLYKRRSDNMYFEALIENLTANPAKNYTIREAEKLAQRVLKDYGADNLNGATPIIKIANSFGFSCIQAQNIPEDRNVPPKNGRCGLRCFLPFPSRRCKHC